VCVRVYNTCPARGQLPLPVTLPVTVAPLAGFSRGLRVVDSLCVRAFSCRCACIRPLRLISSLALSEADALAWLAEAEADAEAFNATSDGEDWAYLVRPLRS